MLRRLQRLCNGYCKMKTYEDAWYMMGRDGLQASPGKRQPGWPGRYTSWPLAQPLRHSRSKHAHSISTAGVGFYFPRTLGMGICSCNGSAVGVVTLSVAEPVTSA